MFVSNPFNELSSLISPIVMQAYIVLMIFFVVGGTLFDVIHKKSARYFFENWRKANSKGNRRINSGELTSIAIQTVAVDVLTSGEFCNIKRRIAHLLTFYGFILYITTTVIMVFLYSAADVPTPSILPTLWTVGGLMVILGGYWFWFFIRVDVSAEGHSPFRIVRADLFVVSLLVSVTMGMIWAYMQVIGSVLFANISLSLYILSNTILFGSVPISKFSHMFFKPAAAFQKRVEIANESRSNLPPPANKPAIFGNPHRQPKHY